MRLLLIPAAAALLAALPGGAHAQAVAGRAYSLSGGARVYEGTGSTVAVALRAEYPLSPAFLVEGAGSVADPVEGAARSATSLFELQAQAQLPGGRVVPYAGVGAGFARFRRDSTDAGSGQALLSVGGGARIGLRRQLGLVADARVRFAADDLADSHFDVTLGLRYRFQ